MPMGRILSFAAFLLVSICHAQIGEWQTFTAMRFVRSIVVTDNILWAATSGGIFSHDLRDGSFKRYTNIDGLNTIDFKAITANEKGTIIAGASNGVLSLYNKSTGWRNVTDISRAVDKPKKGINVLKTRGDLVYIGTDFGLSIYNSARQEFGDSYIKFGNLPSQSQVLDIFFQNDSIWVATDQGIAGADLRNLNLQDPINWISFTKSNGLPSEKAFSLSELDGFLLAGTDNGSAYFDGNEWRTPSFPIAQTPILRLVKYDNGLLALTDGQVYSITSMAESSEMGDNLQKSPYPWNTLFSDILVVGDDAIFTASNVGFAEYRTGEIWNFLKPEGPGSNQFVSLTVDTRGQLWAASGTFYGIYSFDGSSWTNYNRDTYNALPTNDIVVVASDPDGSVWGGTWGEGILHVDQNENISIFNSKNVPGFPGIPKFPNFSTVSGIKTDNKNRAWFLHNESDNGMVISTIVDGGRWKFFPCDVTQSVLSLGNLAIDQYGSKWIIVRAPFSGILVFNDNNTIDNVFDDTWTKIDANDPNGLNAGSINSVTVDNLGDIWIGTNVGLRTIFNPKNPEKVSRTCYNTRCNIEGQVINCIAVDPVNNKWIGTNAGVYVLSPDGGTIIAQYTVDNSPLVANDVKAIVIHPNTGVAYFGTNQGLSSLRTSYVTPQETFSGLRIAPNPFKVGIDDKVMIDGLKEGSTLKIINVSGNLVAEVPTPGGRIGFWDGSTSEGKYAPSGIYFVIAYNLDGSEAAVAKIAVVQP